MNLVKLDSGFNIQVELPIAPFHKRLLAKIIDFALVIAFNILFSQFYSLDVMSEKVWLIVLIELLPALYPLFSEVLMNGQSIGKKALAIRVIAEDGGLPSFSQYLIRYLFRALDFPLLIALACIWQILPAWFFIFCFGGLACLLITPYSQRLGDLVAGTIVIETKTRTSWEDTVFTEIEENYQALYPQVMRLTDKDINTLKSIIGSVKKRSDYDLSMRIAERIKGKLQIESNQDSLDFLETLLKDYNYFSTR